MPSNAKRDGWAIKGPDGVLIPPSLVENRSWVDALNALDGGLAHHEAISDEIHESQKLVGQSHFEPIGQTAMRLGYQLVPVRLVEVEGDDGE